MEHAQLECYSKSFAICITLLSRSDIIFKIYNGVYKIEPDINVLCIYYYSLAVGFWAASMSDPGNVTASNH